jgi:hypothetical protein
MSCLVLAKPAVEKGVMHGLAVGQGDDPQISRAIIPKTADLAAVSAE